MSLAEIWPRFFGGWKGAVDRQTGRLHRLEIRLEVHSARNYLKFVTIIIIIRKKKKKSTSR